jgi:alpha-D-ribose 1-methylphosphonate 5-triphosphate synthase subunit PhnH
MNLNTEALVGGFEQPVFNSQSVFKAAMDGMARPGTIQSVVPEISPPAPLGMAAGALGLTLCDHDTPVWLSAGLVRSSATAWLGFHSGAPITTDKIEARFAFLEAGAPLSSLSQFALGIQEYPDRSVTLILEVADLDGGKELALTGPGIKSIQMIAPVGLPETFMRLWSDNRAIFPRGADVILTSGRRFLCLPRTTKITATEM